MSAFKVLPSIKSPLIVTPTNSPVTLPSLMIKSLIIPESVNNFSIAASFILEKSILANFNSADVASNLFASNLSISAFVASNESIVAYVASKLLIGNFNAKIQSINSKILVKDNDENIYLENEIEFDLLKNNNKSI